MKLQLVVMLAFVVAGTVRADPVVFGLKLGVTTEEELHEMYRVTSDYEIEELDATGYALDPNDIDLREAQRFEVHFDEDGLLAGVMLTLPKHRFDEIDDALTEKYRTVTRDVPFVGTKRVQHEDGDTWIFNTARHPGFEMALRYVRKPYYERMTALDEERRTREAEKERSGL